MSLLKYLNSSENSIAIIFALSLLSLTIPYGIPVFGIFVLFFAILKIFTKRAVIRISKGFILFLFLIIFYIVGLFFTEEMYNRNLSDIRNIISFFLIWILLSDLQREKFKILVNNLAKYSSIVIFFVSIFSLYKFYKYTKGEYFQFLIDQNGGYPSGSSLISDYNMFSLAIFAGLISSIYLFNKSKSFMQNLFYLITIILSFFTIMLAGSRRGWVVLIILLVLYILLIMKRVLLNISSKVSVRGLTLVLIIFFFSISFILIGSITGVNESIRNSQEIERLSDRFDSLMYFSHNHKDSFNERTVRWDFAIELYKEYDFFQFFFGAGFNYLSEFGLRFGTTSGEDYPHNPFLSSLLYSGLIGVGTLIIFTIFSLKKALENKDVLGNYFVFYYFIAWIFIFISGNSIFSNKIFFILVLIILSIPREARSKPRLI